MSAMIEQSSFICCCIADSMKKCRVFLQKSGKAFGVCCLIVLNYLSMTSAKLKDAARGYLYLRMPEDALAELARVPKRKPVDDEGGESLDLELLDLKLAAEMMAKNWNEAVTTSLLLCRRKPKKSRYFIHAAYCLHETGDTHKAKQILLSGPKELLEEPLFHYNMACYLAVLEKPDQAKHYLEKAIELDASLEQTALEDEDLEALH